MTPIASSSPALRLLLAFFLSFVLFTLYGQSHFYRDPGSVFYDQQRAYERRYSNVRQAEVEQARDAVKTTNNDRPASIAFRPTDQASPELCVSMTTVKRDGIERQYVEDAILSMLDGITPQERSSLHLNLLFTDLNATEHPSWHAPWLRSVMDSVWSYSSHENAISPEMRFWLKNITQATKVHTHLQIKATMDYTMALQQCLDATHAPYIAVFEGDILVAPGWVAPTLRALKSADELMRRNVRSWSAKTRKAHDWIDVRLFNQERSTGWSSKRIGGNNEFAIALGVDLALLVVFVLFRRKHPYLQRYLDSPTLLVLCLLVVPMSIVSFFQAGKASLLPPGPGLVVENFGCCSQALIFNRRHVAGLIEYLRGFALKEAMGAEHQGYDMRTRDYAWSNGLDRLALYPVQVQHLGIKSAVGTTSNEAQSVWSMAYEDLKPGELKARHDRAMGELYGPNWGMLQE